MEYDAGMPSAAPIEKTLYDGIEQWMRKEHRCWATGQNTGPRVGRIDVVGVRDIGGDLSGRSEVIAIEVKAGRQPFATCAGQAHGYSVMADRCYLADVRPGTPPFNETELLIAGRLGIGLIAIHTSGRIREVLTAPPHEPLDELRLQVLGKLGLAVCAACSSVFRTSERSNDWKFVSRQSQRTGPPEAVAKGRGYVWWLYQAAQERDPRDRQLTYWRRYLCSDCVVGLFGRAE